MGPLLDVQCMLLCKPGSIFFKSISFCNTKHWSIELSRWTQAPVLIQRDSQYSCSTSTQIPINACIPKPTSVVWGANGFTPGWVLMQLKLVTHLSISSFSKCAYSLPKHPGKDRQAWPSRLSHLLIQRLIPSANICKIEIQLFPSPAQ